MIKDIRNLGKINSLYLRKSSIANADEQAKFELQLSELIKRVEVLPEPYEVFNDEEASSVDVTRPEYNRLKGYIEADKVKSVYVIDDSRLNRNPQEQLAFYGILKKHKVTLFSLLYGEVNLTDKSSELLANIKAVFAGWEYQNTVSKIEEGKLRSTKAGKWNGKIPFGYSKGKDKRLVPNEDAVLVRQMFDWYKDGWTTRQIGAEMTKRTGKEVKSTNVSRFLNRRTYLGEAGYFSTFLDEGVTNPNAHEPIVDKELFLDVQRMLKERNKVQFERDRQTINSERNPLHRLVYCLECGVRRTTSTTVNRGQIYYQKCLKCGNTGVPINVLWDHMLSEAVKVRDQFEEFLAQHDQNDEIQFGNDIRLEEVNARIDDIHTRLEKLVDLSLDGLINNDTFRERKATFETELESLEAERVELVEVTHAKTTGERVMKLEDNNAKLQIMTNPETSAPEVNKMLRGLIDGILFKRVGKETIIHIVWSV